MKKVESIVILIIMTLVMLTGCSEGKNQHEANDDVNEQESLIVGDVELPDNVFSIITFIDNDVVYMADDSENEISIHKFNLASKENSIIGNINDYLMNPANNAVDGKTVYMNYMTLEAERKMVAIDLESLKQEVVVSERDISGLVYCTSMNGNIYSLMHTNDGKSLIKKYIPNSNKETIFIEYEENQVINAIATEGNSLYVLLNSGNKLVIQQIDEEGNTVEEHDVTYVLDQIDSQIGQFFVIRDSFYIRTFSDTSISYKFDGTRLVAVLIVCVGLLVYTNRPYKAISFVLDGDGYSAEVVNGDTLLLQLDNEKGNKEWFSVMTPEFYTCVSMDVKEEYTEFRIRALSEGNGDMGFLCIESDGTKENFVLNLSISRHQNNSLQIDTVDFEKGK